MFYILFLDNIDHVRDAVVDMCIDKWITIRGFSFADSIQELFKQKDKKGTGKAKALRKTL